MLRQRTRKCCSFYEFNYFFNVKKKLRNPNGPTQLLDFKIENDKMFGFWNPDSCHITSICTRGINLVKLSV